MGTKHFIICTSFVLIAGAFTLQSSLAQAGFEWLPDGDTPYSDTPSRTENMTTISRTPPSASSDSAMKDLDFILNRNASKNNQIPPVYQSAPITQKTQNKAEKVPMLPLPGQKENRPIPPVSKIQKAPSTPLVASTRRARVIPPSTAPATQSQHPIIDGFGSEMPLALALQQIAPPQYAFSFDDGINPGYRVSWTGGAPWDVVIQNMLDPLDATLAIQGKKLFVFKKGKQIAPPIQMTQNAMKPVPASSPTKISNAVHETPADKEYKRTMNRDLATPQMSLSSTYGRSNITDPGQERRQPSIKGLASLKRITNIKQLDTKSERHKITDLNDPIPLPMPSILEQARTQSYSSATKPNQYTPQMKKQTGNNINTTMSVQNTASAQPKSGFWEASQGDNLRTTLMTWGKRANVNVKWDARQTYTVAGNVMSNGSFMNALKTVLTRGVGNNTPQLNYIETPGENTTATVIISDPS